jgi:ectoine hydrolase
MPATATLHFPQAEYDRRIGLARAEMSRRGLDLMIVSDPSNMAWLTGYDGWSFYVHQAVLLPMTGEPVWWGRKMDANGALRTCFMAEANIAGYPDHYVQSTERHPMDHLSGLISERGWAKGRIGVEMDNYWYTAAAHASLRSHLKDAALVDANGLVNWQRVVKSGHEVEFIRRAARIVERMHQTIFDMVEPGLPKNRLVAELYKVGIDGADGHWGDYPAFAPMLPSGMDATAPHLTWDDRPFRAGEATFFEIGGCYRRYHCPLSRTVFLGAMPEKYVRAEAAVLAATQAGLEKANPGNTCEEVAIAFFDTLKKHGFEKDSRTGYSIGLSYPPDWGERTLSLRRGDKTVLQENMTIHFMPALWLDDGGLELSETILITKAGAECIASVPRKVVVKR